LASRSSDEPVRDDDGRSLRRVGLRSQLRTSKPLTKGSFRSRKIREGSGCRVRAEFVGAGEVIKGLLAIHGRLERAG